MDINIESLRPLFSSTIWKRGQNYFKYGYVFAVKNTKSDVTAKVHGSENRTYHTHIYLDSNGRVSSMTCDCPYNGMCKHLVATLLYLDNKKELLEIKKLKILRNEMLGKSSQMIKKALNAHPTEEKIDIDWNSDLIDSYLLKKLNSLQGLASETASNQKYKLCFIIRKGSGYLYPNLVLVPGLQQLKSNNKLGNARSFRHELLTEALSMAENTLLSVYNLDEKEELEFRHIAHYIPLLKKTKVYYKDDYRSLKVNFLPIESILISWTFVRFEKKEPIFKPGMTIKSENQSYKIGGDQMLFDLRSLIVLDVQSEDSKETRIFYLEEEPEFIHHLRLLFGQKIFWIPGDVRAFLEFVPENFHKKVSFQLPEKITFRESIPMPVLTLDNSYSLKMELSFFYGENEIAFYKRDNIISETNGVFWKRNEEFEKACDTYLGNYFEYDSYYKGNYQTHGDIQTFFNKHAPKLMEYGFAFRIERHRDKLIRPFKGQISLSTKSGIDWFDFKLELKDKEGQIIPANFSEIEKGKVSSGSVEFIFTREQLKLLKKYFDYKIDKNGHFKIHAMQLSDLDLLYREMSSPDETLKAKHKLFQKLKKLQGVKKTPLPANLKATLRPYQKQGLDWLGFLHENNLNGCLADDMGLGKTLQTLALLQKLKENKALGNCLVVVPVSTIPNWESEIHKFTPDLSVIVQMGAARHKKLDKIKDYDIVLTSYHTLRNDLKIYAEHKWDYLILDEAQSIKNAASQAFKAVRSLKSAHRLSLTGTPLENRTMELWAQMDFLNPGLLGTLKEFRSSFAKPIEENGDKQAMKSLKNRISPFLLRRSKEKVAKDLPEKEEIVITTRLNEQQKALYDQVRLEMRQKVKKIIAEKGYERSSIEILSALLKLRQICLFPGLLDPAHEGIPSEKFELFKTMATETTSEGHKILVFSQFVQVLKRLRGFLDHEKIKYAYIDGQTKNRKKEIENFQNDSETGIFLLSLKAGGVGINLTAADYVLIFDPWWNPAVEQQAIDRAHRIGQKHKVIAYKFITENTVEDKILTLQQKKRELAGEILSSEDAVYKKMDHRDILKLFE